MFPTRLEFRLTQPQEKAKSRNFDKKKTDFFWFVFSRRLLNEEARSLDKADTERDTASRNVKSGFSDPPSSTKLTEKKRDFKRHLQLELQGWFHKAHTTPHLVDKQT